MTCVEDCRPVAASCRWRCTASFTVCCNARVPLAISAIVACITGCNAPLAAWAPSATLSCKDCCTEAASATWMASVRAWNAAWLAAWRSWAALPSRSMLVANACRRSAPASPWRSSVAASACMRSPCAAPFCSSVAASSCKRSTSVGISAACCCIRSKASSRRCAGVKVRSGPAMAASSARPAAPRSRRQSAASRPSAAAVAMPAIEVPKAKPRPLTGAASESRMACRSLAVSSAMPVPRNVAIMPSKVPSMPSSTSRPARKPDSAGAGKAARSPSMRRRTAPRRAGSMVDSQPPRSAGGSVETTGGGIQRRGGPAVAIQFQRTGHVSGTDQQGDQQHPRVGRRMHDRDPRDHGQAQQEQEEMQGVSFHGVQVNVRGAPPAGLRSA